MADEIENSGAPNSVAARLDCADGLSFVIATLVMLAVYLLTLAPEVTVTWSGVMSASAAYGGVAPPAGYPAWTIYSWLFIKLLPFSNIALRVAAGSAVAGAVACGLVALMVSRSGRLLFHETLAFERFDSKERNSIRVVCGCVAGLGLGLSGCFWYEAVIQEYWTFTVLLFVLVVCLLMRWMETGRRRWCWLSFLVYGLLLTGNQELIVALPGIVCMVIMVEPKLGRDVAIVVLPLGAAADWISGFPTMAGFGWNRPILEAFAIAFVFALLMVPVTRGIGSEWKSALVCGLFLQLGLAAYFYLAIASMTNPPVNWAYPRNADGFLHVVSRGQYELVNPTFGFERFASQLWGALNHAGGEFGWIYVAFAILPFGFLRRTAEVGRKWILSLAPVSICVGPLLVILLNPQMDRQSEELFEPYFFALRAVLALWAGTGLMLFAVMVSQPKEHVQCARASITGLSSF
jgi:hypothetical protein